MPLLLLLMAALGLGLGIIVSSLTTKYRDLQVLVTFGVQLLMFIAPVVYPVSMVSPQYRWLILANPMTALIETFRYSFLGAGTFDPWQLLYSTVATSVIFCFGVLLFNKVERTFMDTV